MGVQFRRWGRAPGEGNGDPLQYSCLGNPVDRGAWRATVHRVSKGRTRPSTQACASFMRRKSMAMAAPRQTGVIGHSTHHLAF